MTDVPADSGEVESLEVQLEYQTREADLWSRRAYQAEAELKAVREQAVKVLESNGGATALADLDALLTSQGYKP